MGGTPKTALPPQDRAASLRERQKARGKRQELINYIGIFGNEKNCNPCQPCKARVGGTP
ncbi:hypothetical protein [Moorena producens]|uniref:hypothetical protein n=1 Tax=Moorena producens TaxID=1155739 RepID=UPI003C71ECED